jgi:hypothetical protein
MTELILTNDHRYLLDGKQIDGLTSTISEAGVIGDFGSEWHMTKGTAVHRATEYYDRGTLDESTVDEEIKGYLESWQKYRADQVYKPSEIEIQIYNPVLMVATTIDRLPGPLDIKSGSPEPWHILQIAFQWKTLSDIDMTELIWLPQDVYLDPRGKPPKVKTYKYPELKEAYKVYCSMLHFLRWRRENGYLQR